MVVSVLFFQGAALGVLLSSTGWSLYLRHVHALSEARRRSLEALVAGEKGALEGYRSAPSSAHVALTRVEPSRGSLSRFFRRLFMGETVRMEAMEGDESVKTYDAQMEVCPVCGARANKHYWTQPEHYKDWPPFYHKRFPGMDEEKFFRGPSSLRAYGIDHPISKEGCITLQRCWSCRALWRVRVLPKP